ncbi:hypothetical protein C8R46DRAFT_1218305 [Mycena filopes]|nr:hypothetical protein C8R46DRAFT_1218305 [Mycena filopes]
MLAAPSDADQAPVTAQRHRDNVGTETSPGWIHQVAPAGEPTRSDTSFKHKGVGETTGVLFVEQLQRAVTVSRSYVETVSAGSR